MGKPLETGVRAPRSRRGHQECDDPAHVTDVVDGAAVPLDERDDLGNDLGMSASVSLELGQFVELDKRQHGRTASVSKALELTPYTPSERRRCQRAAHGIQGKRVPGYRRPLNPRSEPRHELVRMVLARDDVVRHPFERSDVQSRT